MKAEYRNNLQFALVVFGIVILIYGVPLLIGCSQAPAQPPEPPQVKVEVLAFTASWCEPCQRAKPILISIRTSGVHVEIIDIDERPELAKVYGITSVPTFFVWVDYKLTKTHDIHVVVQIVKEALK